jgi:dihydroorotate dehydrogenase electron transfer subunit
VSYEHNRGSVFLEDARILMHEAHAGQQFIVRVQAPRAARRAEPGTFAHITCDPSVPMRRPLSIMRANAREGWIEVLYKVVGTGLRHLATRRAGDAVNMLGPIGKGFKLNPERPRVLLVGGGVGIPPMIFLAEVLSERREAKWQPLVLMGAEIPFPFRARPSTIRVPGIPAGAIASMPLLEEWGIASRLASFAEFPGCYHGYVTSLAADWLRSLPPAELASVEMFACGPTVMLKAAAAVAREFGIACQVSLEEFMACAVGGCAGCTVLVQTEAGPAMKRVCVDGPVFDAAAVLGTDLKSVP